MSTISVTNLTTGNNTTDLTINTGNTAGPDVILLSTGGVSISGNSTTNTATFNPNGQIVFANATTNTMTLSSAGVMTVGSALTAPIFFGNTVLVKETSYAANATHTKVANLVAMMVYCVGAGGGGGGATGVANATGNFSASGGGGGGAAVKILLNAEVGTTSNVVVGIGGTGSSNATNVATNGSNSTFANSTGGLITGQGGTGATGATNGNGGAAVNGDLNIEGADGNVGVGGATTLGQTVVGGAGGHSGFGLGHGGRQLRASSAGAPGKLYGGGGGGAAQANTAASVAGGNGANGVVWVIEYYNGV